MIVSCHCSHLPLALWVLVLLLTGYTSICSLFYEQKWPALLWSSTQHKHFFFSLGLLAATAAEIANYGN